MSTDRELLENAAKAAGIGGSWVDAGLNTGSNATPRIWNPLADDGDALRLAVKLPMRAVIDEVWVIERTSIAEWERDPYAATRRAIVRAAAEIGRSKK